MLSARPHGEANALIHLFTEEHGVSHGLARGGASRRQASLWQPGNVVSVSWRARLPDQLGSLTAEPVKAVGARVLDLPLQLGVVTSACALIDGALPQGEAHPRLFLMLVRLLAEIELDPATPHLGDYLRWEADFLAELGYGLDLSCCAVTGMTEGLRYVSPKTGRAVSDEGAGVWKDRLLPLPHLLLDRNEIGSPRDWAQGLDLTGHFLARWVFGVRHLPIPAARERLAERVRALEPGQ